VLDNKPRWRSKGARLVMVGLPLTILATGCGATPPLQIAAVGTASPAAATPAGTEGCWSDDQRVKGDETMARQYTSQPAMRVDPARSYTGAIQTNKGTFEVEFFPEDAPITVNNFVCLAEDGYFDNTPFHRIVKGFVIQGGDPTGTGSGGPGYKFAVLEDLRGKLPKNYTIFGRVTEGMEVVDAIANTPTRTGRSGENSTPTEPVTLEKVTISES